MTWLEAIIIAFIVLGIGWTVWRGGQANPEGTGALGQKVSSLSGKVTALNTRVGHVEEELADLKSEAATVKDIDRIEQLIEERMKTVSAQIDGHVRMSAATNRSVARIEGLLIEKGLGK